MRFPDEPIEPSSGFRQHVLETREPLLVNEDVDERMRRAAASRT